MDLIVNGDDFGLTRGVNAGIIQTFREGILTSATLMANGPAFEDAVELARANPQLGVGIHLCLVGGPAVASAKDIPALADRDGQLPKTLFVLLTRLSGGWIPTRQIEREFRAQIQRVLDAGIRPSHLDTHKHTHTHPRVMEALGRVANEFGIRNVRKPFEDFRTALGSHADGHTNTRQVISAVAAGTAAPLFRLLVRSYGLRTPDHFFGLTTTGRLCSKELLQMLELLPPGTSELMCHPGVCDEELEKYPTRLKRERQIELEALTDPDVRRAAEKRGIRLICYEELNRNYAPA
ncbi:MAG: ChbG/HpnK family deacetylase [Candidatus Acidiferrales bacterium]